MKTLKTYKTAISFIVCSAIFSTENSAQNLSAGKENNFFVMQTGGTENSISFITSLPAVKLFLEQTYASKVNYVEHLFKEEFSPVAQIIAKNYDEKNYIHCIVKNDLKNGILILEKSENGIDFCAADFKSRIGSPAEEICYYFSDVPTSKNVYYRILAMADDGSFSYSDIVRIENKSQNKEQEILKILY